MTSLRPDRNPNRKRATPEQDFHKMVAEYLDLVLTPETFWTTIPLGGGGRLRGAVLKGMGVKAGVPDILLVHRERAFFIELKSARGRMSDAQIETGIKLSIAGGRTFLCRSIDDIRDALNWFGIPTREKTVIAHIERLG
jgi:hypothetical protein